MDRLADESYRVHAIQLPTDVTDFEREYLRPVQRYHDAHEPSTVVGHSLGGLVAAHLETDSSRVYLAPWWGIYGLKQRGWQSVVVPRLPVRAKIIPIDASREEIGACVTDEQWAALPKRISPVFITEIHRAQQALLPISDDDVVFCSLRDTIVSLKAISEVATSDQVSLYDGGHELFSSSSRRTATRDVLTVLAEA
ncbi:alpha/beta fold hydrolase [Halalkalicoccus sp. GCM10025322]|uniref:alpha/beta fold hydrolase n=1 Tax=Halalkalicoccus TaxID=332246 RepID=UPI002F96E25A